MAELGYGFGLNRETFLEAGSQGMLRGQGAIGDVINYGRIEPGDGVGTLVINGVFDNRAAASIEFDVNGVGVEQHDQILVDGSATLAGALSVVFGGDYEEPSVRGQVDVISLIQATMIAQRPSDNGTKSK